MSRKPRPCRQRKRKKHLPRNGETSGRYDLLRFTEYVAQVYLPARDVKPTTCEQYLVAARQLEAASGGRLLVKDLCDEAVQRLMTKYPNAGTANSKRREVLTVWKYAWRKRHVDELPRDVPTRRQPQRLPEAWTVEQVNRLLVECRNVPGWFPDTGIPKGLFWASLAITIYYTGSRPSALLSVRTSDVNLVKQYLTLRAEYTKTARDVLYWLAPQAVESIREIFDSARELVWPWGHCRRHFWRSFRKIVERAGLPSVKNKNDLFYRLRRTNLSYTAAKGGLELARSQAGHHSARLTQRHYVDPRIARQRSAVDVLPPLLESQDKKPSRPVIVTAELLEPPGAPGDGTPGFET